MGNKERAQLSENQIALNYSHSEGLLRDLITFPTDQDGRQWSLTQVYYSNLDPSVSEQAPPADKVGLAEAQAIRKKLMAAKTWLQVAPEQAEPESVCAVVDIQKLLKDPLAKGKEFQIMYTLVQEVLHAPAIIQARAKHPEMLMARNQPERFGPVLELIMAKVSLLNSHLKLIQKNQALFRSVSGGADLVLNCLQKCKEAIQTTKTAFSQTTFPPEYQDFGHQVADLLPLFEKVLEHTDRVIEMYQ